MRKSSGFSGLALIACAISMVACDNARDACKKHSDKGHVVEACMVGASEIGKQASSIADANKLCTQRYNVRTAASEGADAAMKMADEYTGCHCGAAFTLITEKGLQPADAGLEVCSEMLSQEEQDQLNGQTAAPGAATPATEGCTPVEGPGGITRCI